MCNFKQKFVSWTVYVLTLQKVVGKKGAMKYDFVVRKIILGSTLQKTYIYLDVFWANSIAFKWFLVIIYVSYEIILLGD